jgi:integrase
VNARKSRGRRRGQRLIAYFGEDARLVDLTSDRVDQYIQARRAEGAKNATINREVGALRRAWRLAKRAGKAGDVPYLARLEEDNARHGFFEREEFERVAGALPVALQPFVTFMYNTGWRSAEVKTLTWPQVDFVARTVRLEPGTTKNKEGRVFPFADESEVELLLQTQKTRTEGVERRTGQAIPWVFHRDGKPIKSFRRAWLSACQAAGLVGKIPHDFRRTAVRNLERAGVSRSVAMKLVGHKTEAIYRRYAIVAERDLREGVAKVAAQAQVDAAEARRALLQQAGKDPVSPGGSTAC